MTCVAKIIAIDILVNELWQPQTFVVFTLYTKNRVSQTFAVQATNSCVANM